MAVPILNGKENMRVKSQPHKVFRPEIVTGPHEEGFVCLLQAAYVSRLVNSSSRLHDPIRILMRHSMGTHGSVMNPMVLNGPEWSLLAPDSHHQAALVLWRPVHTGV